MLKLTVRLPGRYCIAGHGTDGPAIGKLLSCVLHAMRSRPNSDITALSIEQDVIVTELQWSTDQGFIARVSSTVNEFDREKWSPSGVIHARHMTAPAVDVALAQRKLDEQCVGELRRAVVVPNTRLGHLAGLAFGHGAITASSMTMCSGPSRGYVRRRNA